MEKINGFLDKYFEEERKLHTYRKIPDLETYNQQVHILREFLHEELYGNLGDVEQKFKAPDIFYPKKKSDPLIDGRNLFKISHYEHSIYGDLYIAFVSPSQAKKELLTLTDALFIICVEDEWCIAKKMIFSSYDSDDGKSHWVDGGGIKGLHFDIEMKLIEMNQIKEPSEKDPGFEIYQSNI